MIWVISILAAGLLAGIIALAATSVRPRQSRDEFLKKLAAFLEGKLDPLADRPGCFCIHFVFEGQPFVYEDVEEKGLGKQGFKGYLRAQSAGNLTLGFSEKERPSSVRSELRLASQIPDAPVEWETRLVVPKELREFHVYTNNIGQASAFLQHPKAGAVAAGFKNTDNRGCPFLSLKIQDGLVTLEFHSSFAFRPSRPKLYENVNVIENYLEDMLTVIRALNSMDINQ